MAILERKRIIKRNGWHLKGEEEGGGGGCCCFFLLDAFVVVDGRRW